MEFLIVQFTPDSYVKWVPCHNGMARPQVSGEEGDLQIWRVKVK
jgi:hypothetical protein